ncbi:MAG TPA: class I SAM-dependent methyltransferase [Steroidobacteraceae bacterium]
MSQEADAAAQVLFVPFESGVLAWPSRGAFLRAKLNAELLARPRDSVVCEQSFKPQADALRNAGFQVWPELPANATGLPLVLVLPPRQREEARALLARALRLARCDGQVVAAASNAAGARTLERDFERLSGGIATLSKRKCRVFWTTGAGVRNEALISEWLDLDAPRPILDGRFVSRPGVFAWDRLDAASHLLVEELPDSLSGSAADLGAGFGFIADELLRRCPGIRALDVYEADARALELAKRNLSPHERRVAIEYRWHDVSAGLLDTYDVVVTNPPFHSDSGTDDPGIGKRFIAAAARALNPGGRFYLVANRHLPYEDVLHANFRSVRILAQRDGFKVIEALAPSKRSQS